MNGYMHSEVHNTIVYDTQKLRFLLSVATVSNICGIGSAAIALVVTLIKTVRQVQQATSLRLTTTVSEVLLRDGEFIQIDNRNAAHTPRGSGSLFFL